MRSSFHVTFTAIGNEMHFIARLKSCDFDFPMTFGNYR